MSLKKRVVPCLDVDEGRVVKGVEFEDLDDVGDPADLARRYEEQEADEVVFLDVSASKEGRSTFLETVRRTAEQLFIPLTVGGGIGSVDDIQRALRAGADRVSINTALVADPDLATRGARRFGSQCIVASIDARRDEDLDGWRVHTHGGSQPTDLEAVEWARTLAGKGAGEILLTSMDRDGTRDGFDLELTRAVSEAVDVPVIASGGAGTVDHLAEALEAGGDAALAASIFHYGDVPVDEAKRQLLERGLPLRPLQRPGNREEAA